MNGPHPVAKLTAAADPPRQCREWVALRHQRNRVGGCDPARDNGARGIKPPPVAGRSSMYSQWQVSWRGAIACGAFLLAFACIQTWSVIRTGAPPVPLLGVVILTTGIATAVIAMAFRCGLFLANFGTPGRSFVIASSLISLGLIMFLMLLARPDAAVVFDAALPPAPDPASVRSTHMIVTVPENPVEAILLPYFSLPTIAAFGVARFLRGRADIA